jgi:hypothetical protein
MRREDLVRELDFIAATETRDKVHANWRARMVTQQSWRIRS